MNSGAAATMLLQSITTEARQQMIFRQFEGIDLEVRHDTNTNIRN